MPGESIPSGASVPGPATSESGRPLYLDGGGPPVFGFFHEARTDRRTAALIVPPFGWEEMCSYRARRTWAAALAASGCSVLRLDLPGAGDSAGSPRDGDPVAAWRAAVTGAAGWLRQATGAERTAAVGIGLGGIVAWLAAADGAAIDDFVLWAVPARGRTLVRELRAYARVVADRYPGQGAEPPPPPDGGLEVTGFLLGRPAIDVLETVDLTRIPLAAAAHRRFLLLGRDGLAVDSRLAEHIESIGGELTVGQTDDWAALMSHPQEARTPSATIELSREWMLCAPHTPPPPGRAGSAAAGGAERDRLTVADGVAERPVWITLPSGVRLFGIVAEPTAQAPAPVTGVFLNAGAIRRTGPNRIWVDLARRWAARGVPTVRVDLARIGDSDGGNRLFRQAELYQPEMVEQTLTVRQALPELGLPERAVLTGLCSGAYWALKGALADPAVVGALMINLYAVEYREALVAERDRKETAAALRGQLWRKLAHRTITVEQVRRAWRSVTSRRSRGGRGTEEARQGRLAEEAFGLLRARDVETLLVFGRDEPLLRQFDRDGRLDRLTEWPNVRIETLPTNDHMARALWLQDVLTEILLGALERVLARQAPAPR